MFQGFFILPFWGLGVIWVLQPILYCIPISQAFKETFLHKALLCTGLPNVGEYFFDYPLPIEVYSPAPVYPSRHEDSPERRIASRGIVLKCVQLGISVTA